MTLWPKNIFDSEWILHWRGHYFPQKSHLWEGGGRPECEPQTPRAAAAGEGRTGWIGDALGMLARQHRNLRGWRWKSPTESPHLCNAGPFLSLYSWLFRPLFWGWPMSESSLHKAASGSMFSTVTAHPVIDVFLFKHCGFFPLGDGRNPLLCLDHSKPWLIWVINSLIWGMSLKTCFLLFLSLKKNMESGFKRNPEGTSMLLNERIREVSWSSGPPWST